MEDLQTGKVSIAMRVAGRPLVVEAPVPPDPAMPHQILPILHAIVDVEVEHAIEKTKASGHPVTCRQGCSACCRAQPVPVTPPEAYALLKIVESLPEPRQQELRQRIAKNYQALKEAGLVDALARSRSTLTRDEAHALAKRYFELRLPCPFLEADACSIYEHRPFVCRQYLVTSPVALCDDPFSQPVAVVPMPWKPATATLQWVAWLYGKAQYTVPLALAFDYAEQHRTELEATFAAEPLLRRWLELLCEPKD